MSKKAKKTPEQKAAEEFKAHIDQEIEALLNAAEAGKAYAPPVGRPTMVVGPRVRIYLRALTAGHSIGAACGAAGFSRSVVDLWRKTAKRELEEGKRNSVHIRFLRNHERAMALGMLRKEQDLYAAEKREDDTRSMRNVMAVRFRKDWSDPDKPLGVLRIDPSMLAKDESEDDEPNKDLLDD